jgi:hypothetical protein
MRDQNLEALAAKLARVEREVQELREMLLAMMDHEDRYLDKEMILSKMIVSPPFDEFLKGLARAEE